MSYDPGETGENHDFGIERKVAFLRRRSAYPERPERVEVVETHMSWVFLTDSLVFKLKKPVRYPFLDFSTCDARERDCRAEIHLNRRLAPDVYLEAVPLTVKPSGALMLEGTGAPVDWLVKMRRLPANHMLDRAIARGTVEPEDVTRFAAKLAGFYRSLDAEPITAESYQAGFWGQIELNAAELFEPGCGLPADLVRRVLDHQRQFLEQRAALLAQRAHDRRIVEGHGDLRPEHICLRPEPVFIDCLEFKRNFRIVDPADELAFLSVECEWLGAPEIGRQALSVYTEYTGDHPPEPLIDFYRSCRAALRARLSIAHVKEDHIPDHPKWIRRAREYLSLAHQYCVWAG